MGWASGHRQEGEKKDKACKPSSNKVLVVHLVHLRGLISGRLSVCGPLLLHPEDPRQTCANAIWVKYGKAWAIREDDRNLQSSGQPESFLVQPLVKKHNQAWRFCKQQMTVFEQLSERCTECLGKGEVTSDLDLPNETLTIH